jgi:hypothetical protein
MKTTSYEKCKEKVMEKIMKEYEKGILKSAKSRKQAIAIGLSISEKECKNKFGKSDVIKIEKNIKENDNKSKLSVAFVKDCNDLIIYYKKKKEIKKANNVKKFIIERVLNEHIKTKKVNKLMLEIIKDLI